MNREEYLAELETQNGYCSCEGLESLFEQSRRTEELEAKCDFVQRNVDLDNPEPEDLEFLVRYGHAVEQLRDAAGEYHREIRKLSEDGKLKLVLHDRKTFQPKREVSYIAAYGLLEYNDPIITIHCSRCGQQIDIASLY